VLRQADQARTDFAAIESDLLLRSVKGEHTSFAA
jgi:hypothetical protein